MNTRPGVEFTNVRMLRVARFIYEGGTVTSAWMMQEYGISLSTAKKDMALIGMYLPVEIDQPEFAQAGQRRKCLRLARAK